MDPVTLLLLAKLGGPLITGASHFATNWQHGIQLQQHVQIAYYQSLRAYWDAHRRCCCVVQHHKTKRR